MLQVLILRLCAIYACCSRPGEGKDTVKAVDGVDFDVRAGETFGIIGGSGSGKTTLARALVPPSAISAEILHHGLDPATLRGAAFLRTPPRLSDRVSGSPTLQVNPRITIFDNAIEPAEIMRDGSDEFLPQGRFRRAAASVRRASSASPHPHQLSGGQNNASISRGY